MDVIVETADLGRCIRAVLPHVSVDKDDVLCQHIELRIAPTGDLLLSATDRYTAVVAVVSVEDNLSGEVSVCHLHSADAKQLAAMFKASADVVEGQERLRLVAYRDTLQVIDYSGLFEGKEATWPAAPRDDFPPISHLVNRVHDGRTAAAAAPAAFAADHLARFGMSGRALRAPVVFRQVEAQRPTIAVHCGEDLAGVLLGITPDPEERRTLVSAWRSRLDRADLTGDPTDVEALVVDLEAYLARRDDDDPTPATEGDDD